MSQPDLPLTGGCQCGAVRYRAAKLGSSGLCHCRMCQKAYGSIFAIMVTTQGLEWTRGAPNWFHSSDRARRGFCAECGTPLCYQSLDEDHADLFEVAVGTLDHPELAPPRRQLNLDDKVPFFDALPALPTLSPAMVARRAEVLSRTLNHQHPDHDTTDWVPHHP